MTNEQSHDRLKTEEKGGVAMVLFIVAYVIVVVAYVSYFEDYKIIGSLVIDLIFGFVLGLILF